MTNRPNNIRRIRLAKANQWIRDLKASLEQCS